VVTGLGRVAGSGGSVPRGSDGIVGSEGMAVPVCRRCRAA